MKAMCIADSTCVQKGCSRDVFGRLGCGYFRMNIWQFKVTITFLHIENRILFVFSNAMNQVVKLEKIAKVPGSGALRITSVLPGALK